MDIDNLKKIYKKNNFSLNTTAVNNFKRNCDPRVRRVINKLIEKTLYVPFDIFIVQLNNTIDAYINTYRNKHTQGRRPIFICEEADPTKKWLYNYVTTYFIENLSGCEVKFIPAYPGRNADEIKKSYGLQSDDIIIFVDDCMYSGGHIGSLIDMFRHIKKTVNFYILVPYGSKKAKQYIEYKYNYESSVRTLYSSKRQRTTSSSDSKLIFCKETFLYHSMTDIISLDGLDLLSQYYPQSLLNTHLDSSLSLIYFDHKLADYSSVPAIIYLGVVANNKNADYFRTHSLRSIANFPEFSSNLDIIPLINNCSNFTSDINLEIPMCPRQVDSDEFNDFVSKLPSSVGGRKKTTTRRGRPRKT